MHRPIILHSDHLPVMVWVRNGARSPSMTQGMWAYRRSAVARWYPERSLHTRARRARRAGENLLPYHESKPPDRASATMASRRAVVSLVQAAVPSSRAALPARAIRVASQLSLRQYHNRAQQHCQPLLQPSASCARYCATRTALAAKTRAYSTESEAKDTPFRVWDFEGVCHSTL